MSQVGDVIDPALLDRPVAGSNLFEPDDDGGPASLRDQLDPRRPSLLVFLRHLGCPFCREMVKDLRVAAERADAVEGGHRGEKRYPRVLFFHTLGPRVGGRFFGRYWPAAPAVSDPGRHFYDALDIPRASAGQVFGPRTWPCLLRAGRKGHHLGRIVGDLWTMPGLLLVSPAGRIVARHDFPHIGRRIDFDRFAFDAEPGPQPPAPAVQVAAARGRYNACSRI